MRVFICAGEPSGDVHGANLVRTLRQLRPDIECVGFGGDKMAAAGCRLLYPLCQLAVVGLARVLASAHLFLDLISRADRFLSQNRPDAVVLIDYPGFNWWLARRAHFRGIPVFYFVPPQLWGWAGWRVKKMRRWVDHVLCSLPFEEAWYQTRGVDAHYIGHPFFDELPRQTLDQEFMARQRERPGKIIAILPGSRTQEVEHNLSGLVRAAATIHAARPDTRFLVASFKQSQQRHVDAYLRGKNLPMETFVGKTPEIIHLAHSCLSVSGSVSLELLYHGKPTVVVYRVDKFGLQASRWLKTSRYICLVNLLANKELYPEFLTDKCEAKPMAEKIIHWLNNPEAHKNLVAELITLRGKVAAPGACERAARFVLDAVSKPVANPGAEPIGRCA